MRPRTLVRSEAPGTLDASSLERLAGLDVRLVFDLRSEGENEPAAGIWAEGSEPELVHLELFPRAEVEGDDRIGPLMADHSGAATRRYMFAVYDNLVDRLADGPLAEFARRVGDEGATPVLLHCTAGQDRTGVLVAAVLLALGVPREAVVADYMVTGEHFGLERMLDWLRVRGAPESEIVEAAVAPFVVTEAYIEHAIDAILERHGTIESYWAHAGVDADGMQRLRARLLE